MTDKYEEQITRIAETFGDWPPSRWDEACDVIAEILETIDDVDTFLKEFNDMIKDSGNWTMDEVEYIALYFNKDVKFEIG